MKGNKPKCGRYMRRRAMKIDRTDAIHSKRERQGEGECLYMSKCIWESEPNSTEWAKVEKKIEEFILCSQITSLFLIVVVVSYAAADTAVAVAALGNIYIYFPSQTVTATDADAAIASTSSSSSFSFVVFSFFL